MSISMMPEQQTLLHLLRNPNGWSESTLREARLKAADELEKLWGAQPMVVEKLIQKPPTQVRPSQIGCYSLSHGMKVQLRVGQAWTNRAERTVRVTAVGDGYALVGIVAADYDPFGYIYTVKPNGKILLDQDCADDLVNLIGDSPE